MTLTPTFINGYKYAIETHPGLEPRIHALGDGLAMSAFSESSRRIFREALAEASRPDLTEDQRVVIESFLTLCSILREPPERLAVMLSWQSEGIARYGMQFAEEGQVGALSLDEWGGFPVTEYRFELHRKDAHGFFDVVTVSHWFLSEKAMRKAAQDEFDLRQDETLTPVFVSRGGYFCDEGEAS